MRVYAFTDLHGNLKALANVKAEVKKEKPNLVVCCGDLTVFEQDLKALLSRVNMLRVPVVMLHGNHEDEKRMRKLCKQFSRITFLHKEFVEIDGWFFVAYGGGGFEDRYPELEKLAKSKEWEMIDWEKTVFLSHAPPYKTALDDVGEEGEEWHVGSRTLTKLIKKKQPLLVLAGHIHECFGASTTIKKTLCENPTQSGKLYDLEALEKELKRA